MKPLYTQEDFNNSNSKDKLLCECYFCKNPFYITKHEIQRASNKNNTTQAKYCSRKCTYDAAQTSIHIECANCNQLFKKKLNQFKKTKNHFCSRSCSVTYNNKNKAYGTRRSRLESWLEERLTQLYPSLHMDFNQKTAINSELDIYIPSLNLAFELNGIFHYEPIYGVGKLRQIQENDISKSKACHEAKIDLCTIDTSGQKYFKESTSQKYLDIINNIIKERLLTT
jgi:hypothetical protein